MLYHPVSAVPLMIAGVIAILAFIPLWRILRRLGYSGWWAIVGIISPINIIGLWVLAYARWPVETARDSG